MTAKDVYGRIAKEIAVFFRGTVRYTDGGSKHILGDTYLTLLDKQPKLLTVVEAVNHQSLGGIMNKLKKLLEKAKENQAIYQSPAVVRVSIPDAEKLLAVVVAGKAVLKWNGNPASTGEEGDVVYDALEDSIEALDK